MQPHGLDLDQFQQVLRCCRRILIDETTAPSDLKHFLVSRLSDSLPDLAIRILKFSERQLQDLLEKVLATLRCNGVSVPARSNVLSLGQCGADHAALTRWFGTHFQAKVIAADTPDGAQAELGRGGVALVLVNRVLDYSGESGLEFIRRLKADRSLSQVPVMLVSNFEEAQREAARLGALPGFGKAELTHPQTLVRLRAVLGREEAAPAEDR